MCCVAVLVLCGSEAAFGADAASTDKTLVSWVTLDNIDQRGGSVLTIQQGARFDGIVFGEIQPGQWMAGSDGFTRTERDQAGKAVETADPDALIQIAIVYKGNRILIYRNGQPYTSYDADNIDLLGPTNNMAVFGLRHVGAETLDGRISGTIEDARIYDQALTEEEIQALRPNMKSAIEPYAWWDFEGDAVQDRTSRFRYSILEGGATLADGKLVLGKDSVLLAMRSENAVRKSQIANVPFEIETPAMPDPIPDTWLTYHLAHPGPDNAIPADPNCAIYFNGKYHLHYIYQSHGHSFAHVTSDDMVHWQWQPTVLTPPLTGHGMFSGTAFLTKEGVPAIIYHGAGSDRNQIAFAKNDDLSEWTKPIAVEPRTADGEPADMRHWDPDCWRIGDTYYALGGGGNPTLATSDDLKDWVFQGELFHPDFPTDLGVEKGEDVSCANMFPIGDKWMLLCISHGLGARYYLGDFKDGKYLPDHHALLNWAAWDFFAPESLLTPDGRRVMWAWCTPWVNDMQRVKRTKDFDRLMNEKLQPGIQSLPRELSLGDDGMLVIKPLSELAQLRANPRVMEDVTMKSGEVHLLKDMAGDTVELEVVFDKPQVTEFGLRILADESGKNGFKIAYRADRKTMTLDYVEPPFELKPGEDLRLRIFIDKGMIEVFANDRQAAVAWHDYEPENQHVALYSNGGDIKVRKITCWSMKSIY
jgi:sucrose-6-phosphate hydrolase SacC (GH32 family)